MDHSTSATHFVKGLQRLVATVQKPTDSELAATPFDPARPSLLDCQSGRATYCNADLTSLCEDGCFEAVMWLLLHRTLPDAEQLADCAAILSDAAVIDRPIAETIATIPLQTRPLDLFPLSINLLSCFDPSACDTDGSATRSQFWRLMAQLPVLMHAALGGDVWQGRAAFASESSDPEIAEYEQEPCASWAGRLLQMLRNDGKAVSSSEEHAMNVLMTCQCITDDRAADQSARFVGSAVTDIAAAWKSSSAVFASQLKNDPFLWSANVMSNFESPADAEAWWHQREGKPMPFGFHRRPECSRSVLLREQCRELLGSVPAMVLEASASRLESVLATEGLCPTVDWTATRLFLLLGVPVDRISVGIGMARLVGWAAHHLDQCERGSAA